MLWNWQLPEWPQFTYEKENISQKEKQFLLNVGSTSAFIKTINKTEYHQFVIEILSMEGMESSKIEGEILDRESLQSSIKKHFGLKSDQKKEMKKEQGMATVLCDVYDSFNEPLTSEMLWQWHEKLLNGASHIEDLGKYRTHKEPMQIVSRRHIHKVFFEAPPSVKVPHEMRAFIEWFNRKKTDTPILGRAAIAHLYFESIHPFEDGNGRIGRLLVEKVLSQGVARPMIAATSKILEKRKAEYYAALEKCNRTLKVDDWVEFFSDCILQGQELSIKLLYFLIAKSKLFTTLQGKLNARQEKALLRMFAEGLDGFQGGLSAENYMAITHTTRATTTRDLADLVQKGALTKTGELRHTRYWLRLEQS